MHIYVMKGVFFFFFISVRDMASMPFEVQFRCCICLDTYVDPVSIPCGHNFCLDCIEGYWDTKDNPECPLCKETFRERPDLRINRGFEEMVRLLERFVHNRFLFATFFSWYKREQRIWIHFVLNSNWKASAGPTGTRGASLRGRGGPLRYLPGRQVHVRQVVPGVPDVLLWAAPRGTPQESSAAETQADGAGHISQQPPVQEAQQATDDVLQDRPDARVCEVFREGS